MRAVLLPGDGTAEVAEREVPTPGPHEVLVRTRRLRSAQRPIRPPGAELIGAWVWPISEFDQMVSLPTDNTVPIKSIVSARRDLGEASDAFSRFDRPLTEKGMFVWEPEGRND